MSRWADAETWAGADLRREVFFFRSCETELYGSIYATPSPSPLGVVFCNSWGIEGEQGSRLMHPVALSVAEAGGVAVIFHYPGFGDSHGDLAEATMDILARSAVDAVCEASRRHPNTHWILAGLMFGASVASLAADRGAAAEELLLIQPVLRPRRYFTKLERVAKLSLGGPIPSDGSVFGYRLPEAMISSTAATDAILDAAFARFCGEGTIIRYENPGQIEGAPDRFQHVCAPGTWRFGSHDHNHRDPALVRATAQWLTERVATAVSR
jgi:hypothetical protein